MASIKGFSLRQSLIDNGVTTEEATRGHLSFVYACIKAPKVLSASGAFKGRSRINVCSYRPPVNNPNALF